MITTYQEGTATIGTTEYSLANASTILTPKTDAAVFQPVIDFSAMTSTEQYQITIYEKVKAAGTQHILFTTTLSGAQTESPVWFGPALSLLNGWDMTVKKLLGTDRSIDFSIRKAS